MLKNNRLLGAFFCAFLFNVFLSDFFQPLFLNVRTVFLMGIILHPHSDFDIVPRESLGGYRV